MKDSIFSSALSWLQFSQPHRQTFGQISGMKLALQLRKLWHAPAGSICEIQVPGIAHPVLLRAGTSDDQVFLQIFIEEELAFPLTNNPQFIIDAGANIGLSAIFLANRYPNARIVCLEIESSNFALLQKNVAPYPNITPMLKGLWSGKTFLDIANPDASHWAFTAAEAAQNSAHKIEAVGVHDLMEEFGVSEIDLLKIDIEGGEVEVFGANTENWISNIKTMAVELHDRFRPGCTETLEKAAAPVNFSRSQRGEYMIFARA